MLGDNQWNFRPPPAPKKEWWRSKQHERRPDVSTDPDESKPSATTQDPRRFHRQHQKAGASVPAVGKSRGHVRKPGCKGNTPNGRRSNRGRFHRKQKQHGGANTNNNNAPQIDAAYAAARADSNGATAATRVCQVCLQTDCWQFHTPQYVSEAPEPVAAPRRVYAPPSPPCLGYIPPSPIIPGNTPHYRPYSPPYEHLEHNGGADGGAGRAGAAEDGEELDECASIDDASVDGPTRTGALAGSGGADALEGESNDDVVAAREQLRRQALYIAELEDRNLSLREKLHRATQVMAETGHGHLCEAIEDPCSDAPPSRSSLDCPPAEAREQASLHAAATAAGPQYVQGRDACCASGGPDAAGCLPSTSHPSSASAQQAAGLRPSAGSACDPATAGMPDVVPRQGLQSSSCRQHLLGEPEAALCSAFGELHSSEQSHRAAME